MNTKKIFNFLLEKRSIVILFVLLLCACLFTTEFLKPSNLSNVLLQVATDGIVAVGVTFIVLTGGIDLSVASVASLTGMLIAYGYTKMGISPVIMMIVAILIGVGLGTIMGLGIHYLNVPPFIMTLTGNFLARGVCSLISRESISIDHPLINKLAGIKITLYKLSDGEWVKIKPITSISLTVIIFLVIIVGLILLGKGIDLIRRLFGLEPKSRFRWNVNVHTDDGRGQQQTTTRTSDGVTIIDRRSQEETNKKIFAPDEGEYVEYREET